MQYITKDDLLSLIDSEELNDITDGDDSLILKTEGRAIDEVSTYLNVRFSVELIFNSPKKHDLLVMYLCDIVLYHLHARIAPNEVAEVRVKRYDSAINWLEKVADGFTAPLFPTKEDQSKMPIRFGSSSKKQNPYY